MPKVFNGDIMLQTVNRRDMGMYVQRTITVLLVVYVFDVMADTFRPRLDMPKDLPMQIHNARKALQLIEQGQQLSGFLILAQQQQSSVYVGHHS